MRCDLQLIKLSLESNKPHFSIHQIEPQVLKNPEFKKVCGDIYVNRMVEEIMDLIKPLGLQQTFKTKIKTMV